MWGLGDHDPAPLTLPGPPQVALVQDDHVVETLAANAPDNSLGEGDSRS